jgi:hypothetical protein
VSSDFESVHESDDFESERPDPEEPSTFQHPDERSDAEVDVLDWADQHAMVEDPSVEEDAPGSDVVTSIASSGPNVEL